MNVCQLEGCDRKVKAYGWCRRHWDRIRKGGSPDYLGRSYQKSNLGKVSGYAGVHARIKRSFGVATAFTCECGSQADEWAFTGGPLTLKDKTKQFIFSPRVVDYTPKCLSCHRKMDAKKG